MPPRQPTSQQLLAAGVPPVADAAEIDPLAGLTVLVPRTSLSRSAAGTDSRATVAYYLIRDLVVTLDLAPGTPLSERTLMDRLGLGRTPVREALRRLADEGLVAIFPRRGMVVAPINVQDLTSISEVRIDLESLAAALAAERCDDTDRAEGTDLLHALDDGIDPADQRALIRLDQRVHHLIHRATHNTYLQNTLGDYLALSLRLWFLGLNRVHRLDEAVQEHRTLLTAVLAGNPDTAAATARAHVTGFYQEIRHVL